MSEMKSRKDFVRKTNEMLRDNWDYLQGKDKEVTFLLNCMLGLIVAIVEDEEIAKNKFSQLFKDDFDKCFLKLLPDKIGFIDPKQMDCSNLVDEGAAVNVVVVHKDALTKKHLHCLLKRIRNGIAHLNIEFENNKEGQIEAIRLWNNPTSYAKNVKDVEIEFTVNELKKLAIELSKRYEQLIPDESI